MSKSSAPGPWLLLMTISFLFSGCMALPFLIPPLVEFGASLLKTAFNNYGTTHQQNMENLLVALQQRANPLIPQGIIANPDDVQPGGYQGTIYPNQNYQAEQGYPHSQEYPFSSNSSPQAYTYPNNQHAYSNQNPYPNQGPAANQQSYPGQGQPYPDTSYQMGQQEQSYPAPYEHAGIPSASAYPKQAEGSPVYQPAPSEWVQPTAAPIGMDVLLVKKHQVNGVQSYLPIKDGDILFDGRGNPQAGDKFRVMFRANTDCYVYVIAVDGSAWAQGLFPTASSPFANPVKAGQQQILPEGNNWFSLDQYKGIETIFFVASHGRRQDIEQILATITGRERNPMDKPHAVSEPAIIPNGYSGVQLSSFPFTFPTSPHQQQELLPTTYFVKTAGEDLRITRWFRHQ